MQCHKPNCTAQKTDVPGERYCLQCQKFLEGTFGPMTEHKEFTELTEYVEIPDPNAYEGPEKKLVECIRRAVMARGGFMFRVAQRGGSHSGTEEGCPDTFISIAGDRSLFRAVEIKPAYGVVRPEQKRWVCKGLSVVVRSVQRALEVCGYNE